MRHCWLVLIVVAGCDRPPGSAAEPAATVSSAAPATTGSTTTAAPSASAKPVKQAADGRCEPIPKHGAPCAKGDSYCVESWGKPGGRSSALWCRDGRWQREEEDNLP